MPSGSRVAPELTLAHAPSCTRLRPLVQCPACLAPQVVTTLTTVGFGDVVAQTMLGRAVIILTICFGVVAIPVQVGPGLRYNSHGSRGLTYLAPPCQHSRGLAYLAPPCQPAPLSPAQPPASVVCQQCAAHAIVPRRRHSCMPSSRRGGWCAVRAWLCSCPLYPLGCCMHSAWAGLPAAICAVTSTRPFCMLKGLPPVSAASPSAVSPTAAGSVPSGDWRSPMVLLSTRLTEVRAFSGERAAHPPGQLSHTCRSMWAAAMPPGMWHFCPAPRRQWPVRPQNPPSP